jgi:hypothetical protein
METHAPSAAACEDDTSDCQIFNRESFSLRGLVVMHRVHSTERTASVYIQGEW